MKIENHIVNNIKIAEIISEDFIIQSIEDGADLLGNLYYSDYDRIILYEKNLLPDFFNLKTGVAGEILQKFANFRVRLAIVGNFDKHKSNSLKQFIFESNKGKQVNFVDSLSQAIDCLAM
ncbi:DUF4180 domain-containing protein [Flavobacterium seoulense]|uniref:DUF4180 domain-containing protein n=1 Tax=Flavobacterium seoulense TaxID=1492738 RepID=A0A066WY76_9FLAO|nr:DUF4180 domain-containing protein [Flavobacterium seoulense]KDN55849.1 hypothetical protein FEM21_10400 [Flavobacterium seoulense]